MKCRSLLYSIWVCTICRCFRLCVDRIKAVYIVNGRKDNLMMTDIRGTDKLVNIKKIKDKRLQPYRAGKGNPFNPFIPTFSGKLFHFNCRRDHCVQKMCKKNPGKTAKIEIERKRRNELPKSVDPDEMDHLSHLIWIYTVCPAILFSRLDSTLYIPYHLDESISIFREDVWYYFI